jgi:hypothetical protein
MQVITLVVHMDTKPNDLCPAFYVEQIGRSTMARGSKKKYTSKQKRKAEHIEKGYKKRGVSGKEAERRAWATVNKSDRGGRKKGGGGRGKKRSKSSSRKGGRKGGRDKS